MEWVTSSLVKSSLQRFVCACLCVLVLCRGSEMPLSSLGSRGGRDQQETRGDCIGDCS